MKSIEFNDIINMLLVIKKYYSNGNDEDTFETWYVYAIENSMEFFNDRVEVRYKLILETPETLAPVF